MKIGEKCTFTVGKDMFGGKIKAGHKYVGKCAGDALVSYRNCIIQVKSIKKVERSPIKKDKAPTASDYKKFADVCFECGIRYRDNWTSVISGKRFTEGDWNGLQAGHGVSRQHWATRHDPMNCHAITSGENFHMSIGTATIIAKYWAYVIAKYGQDVVDRLLDKEPESPKLTIPYLKEDCRKQYNFLAYYLLECRLTNNTIPKTVESVIKWRCEKLPKKQADGVLKVLKLITEGEL